MIIIKEFNIFNKIIYLCSFFAFPIFFFIFQLIFCHLIIPSLVMLFLPALLKIFPFLLAHVIVLLLELYEILDYLLEDFIVPIFSNLFLLVNNQDHLSFQVIKSKLILFSIIRFLLQLVSNQDRLSYSFIFILYLIMVDFKMHHYYYHLQ